MLVTSPQLPRLRPMLEREGRRQLIEARGRGRSGAHPARVSREAIKDAMHDLYTQLQALGLSGGPR